MPLGAATLREVARRVAVPRYDRGRLATGVVHLGVGAFHRAHQAVYHDRLLEGAGAQGWGICGVGVLDGDRRVRDALDPQDGLYTVVAKHGDGTQDVRVVGSVVEYLFAPDDPDAVVERMASAEVRIVSLTITEGGYAVDPEAPAFAHDIASDAAPRTARAAPRGRARSSRA